SYRACPILRCIIDQKPSRQKKVTREQHGGPAVVENQMIGAMPRRWKDIDNPPAKIQLRGTTRPSVQAMECPDVLQALRRDPDSGEIQELRVASPMITMAVGVGNDQRDRGVAAYRQQSHHCFRERHLLRVFYSTGIDQKSALGADEKIHKAGFEVSAGVLPQDERLRLVGMDLEGRLRGC